jgi:hypothetical protein
MNSMSNYWEDEDTGRIRRIEVNVGKYKNLTAIGSITVSYGNQPGRSHGLCHHVTHIKRQDLVLQDRESIKSVKVYNSFGAGFVSGLEFQTTKRTVIFGIQTRNVKLLRSPYQNGYYISVFTGAAGDVLTDLNARFQSEFISPFAAVSPDFIPPGLTSNSTSSTLSSHGSATELNMIARAHQQPASNFHLELQNRLTSHVTPNNSANQPTQSTNRNALSPRHRHHSTSRLMTSSTNQKSPRPDQPMRMADLDTTYRGATNQPRRYQQYRPYINQLEEIIPDQESNNNKNRAALKSLKHGNSNKTDNLTYISDGKSKNRTVSHGSLLTGRPIFQRSISNLNPRSLLTRNSQTKV